MNSVKLLAAALALGLGATFSAQADEEKDWSLDLSTGVYTSYMWRGLELYDGASTQPSVNANYLLGDYGKLTGGLWTHLSTDKGTAIDGFTENDWSLAYSVTLDNVTATIGNLWYVYPRDEIRSSEEVYGVVAVDTFLSPVFSVYQDYNLYDSTYYELGLSHKFEPSCLGEGFNFTSFVNFGFASNSDKVYTDDGLEHVTFGVYSSLALGDVTVTPSLTYTAAVDDTATSKFWAGVSFGYSL